MIIPSIKKWEKFLYDKATHVNIPEISDRKYQRITQEVVTYILVNVMQHCHV